MSFRIQRGSTKVYVILWTAACTWGKGKCTIVTMNRCSGEHLFTTG